jgi:hypothetical protein
MLGRLDLILIRRRNAGTSEERSGELADPYMHQNPADQQHYHEGQGPETFPDHGTLPVLKVSLV